MENTIKNMGLALTKMEMELNQDGINQAKTLSNTYNSLMKQYISGTDYNIPLKISHVENLNWQHVRLLKLFGAVNKMVSRMLEEQRYVGANNLSVVSDKLIRSASELKSFLGSEARINNLSQNRNKEIERVKQVTIFGMSHNSASNKYMELRKIFENDIIKTINSAHELSFETKDLKVVALKFSDSHRGYRLDEIYVDKELTISSLNLIQMMKRDKNTLVHYF